MNLKQLTRLIRSRVIDTVLVAFPDPFGRLVGKRFCADFFLDSLVKHGTHGCNYLLLATRDEPLRRTPALTHVLQRGMVGA